MTAVVRKRIEGSVRVFWMVESMVMGESVNNPRVKPPKIREIPRFILETVSKIMMLMKNPIHSIIQNHLSILRKIAIKVYEIFGLSLWKVLNKMVGPEGFEPSAFTMSR